MVLSSLIGYYRNTRATTCYDNTEKWFNLVIKIKEEFKRPLTNEIGPLIKYYRNIHMLTQIQLAALLGYPGNRSMIKDYELEKKFPSRENSIKLASIFKVGTKYFYDDYLSFLDDFTFKLNAFLKKSEFSILEIANTLEITYETLIRWKNGAYPSRKNYLKLKKLLE